MILWKHAIDAIERAVEYFKGTYRIPVSNLFHIASLIVPFAYFFYNHNDKPSGKLTDFIYKIYFGDVRFLQGILHGEEVTWPRI